MKKKKNFIRLQNIALFDSEKKLLELLIITIRGQENDSWVISVEYKYTKDSIINIFHLLLCLTAFAV